MKAHVQRENSITKVLTKSVKMPRKGRYHHIKFDDTEEFETPAFQFLNERGDQEVSSQHVNDSDNDILLQDSDGDDSEIDVGFSDEDDAPENVSFKTGRQAAIQQMRESIRLINEEKIKVREKRRKIDEKFKEQKKRKIENLKRARLPDDFLEDLPDKLPTKIKVSETEEKKDLNSDGLEKGSSLDEDEGSFADTEDDFEHNEDFIPLNSDRFGGVEVQPLKEYQKKTVSLALTAAEFKSKHLYGSRIPRESTKAKMAKQEKRKAYR